jgi:hypothetical protein
LGVITDAVNAAVILVYLVSCILSPLLFKVLARPLNRENKRIEYRNSPLSRLKTILYLTTVAVLGIPGPGPYYPYFYKPWYGLGGYHPLNWTYFPERMLGSSILDRPLLSKYGDAVGNLKDLLIDSTNKVTKLIVSTGEVLGIGDREVAIPFRPLGFSFEGVEYDITAEQLESMPAYEK